MVRGLAPGYISNPTMQLSVKNVDPLDASGERVLASDKFRVSLSHGYERGIVAVVKVLKGSGVFVLQGGSVLD
ncbi:hypothetical protein V6N13_114954 [Hibiscus sabdariffa]